MSDDAKNEKAPGQLQQVYHALFADLKTGKVEFSPREQFEHSLEATKEAVAENWVHGAQAFFDAHNFKHSGHPHALFNAVGETVEMAEGLLSPKHIQNVVARDLAERAEAEQVKSDKGEGGDFLQNVTSESPSPEQVKSDKGEGGDGCGD